MVNLLGEEMKEYIVKPCDFTDNKEIIITRNEIKTMKNKCKSGGYKVYDLMLNVLQPKVASQRVCLIPGTKIIVWCLSACIISVRILLVTAIILLFYKMWFISLGTFILVYLIGTPIQTYINYELGARLFVLDQKLSLESEIDFNNFDYFI